MSDRRPCGGWVGSPYAFLGGVICAFLGCCAAGWTLGGRNGYEHFVRFHPFLSPETSYFPTASQVGALGRARLDPAKVAVVVGGNSILHGVGQGPQEVWTGRLQQELGDEYQVINFGMRGATPGEFGEIAAEMLERDGRRVLFVSDCGSSTIPGEPDGIIYRYFFWDAYYKGLVRPDPVREEALARTEAAREARGEGPAFDELRRGRRLDAGLRFQDLWTDFTYQRCSTVWTPPTGPSFLRARKRYAEGLTPQPPVEARYPPAGDQYAMYIVHSLAVTGPPMAQQPVAECVVARAAKENFPEGCRRRTLMLVVRDSPHYVRRMEEADQRAYSSVFPAFVRAFESAGMAAMDVGGDYSDSDFIDRCHLSEEGGRRLAADVAPKIRELAERLGYVGGGEGP